VANGSPIGDSLPVLMALDARVVLRHGQQVREVLLAEFYPGYQKTLRQAGEVITALRLPRLPAGEVRAYKVSKRRDQDISAVCAAFWCSRAADGTLRELRAAFGGLAAVATRAQGVEVALIGNGDSGSWDRARAAVAQQFTPLTDGRATADYRLTVATNLLTRWQAECAAGGQS
jgi:xanthine dehydrogenase small subunit